MTDLKEVTEYAEVPETVIVFMVPEGADHFNDVIHRAVQHAFQEPQDAVYFEHERVRVRVEERDNCDAVEARWSKQLDLFKTVDGLRNEDTRFGCDLPDAYWEVGDFVWARREGRVYDPLFKIIAQLTNGRYVVECVAVFDGEWRRPSQDDEGMHIRRLGPAGVHDYPFKWFRPSEELVERALAPRGRS